MNGYKLRPGETRQIVEAWLLAALIIIACILFYFGLAVAARLIFAGAYA